MPRMNLPQIYTDLIAAATTFVFFNRQDDVIAKHLSATAILYLR